MSARRLLVCLTLMAAIHTQADRRALAQPARAESGEIAPLVTRDGVQLKITYFPSLARKGSPQSKQSIPVVFLHDHKSSRSVFAQLAQKLQAMGEGEGDKPSFAVVTVDLRGHGESVKQVSPNGVQADLDAARLGKEDLIAMVAADMNAVRDFLVDKNDAGELNLNKLCLVGSGMGASVAANWALTDWSYPPLAVGKQGQDVKAVALVSPRWLFNGLSMQGPMQFRALKENVSWLLIYGDKDAKVQADANRIKNQLERFHPASKQSGAPRSSGLTVLKLATKLQGDSLITQNGSAVETQIIKFLLESPANSQQPWLSRRNRLP